MWHPVCIDLRRSLRLHAVVEGVGEHFPPVCTGCLYAADAANSIGSASTTHPFEIQHKPKQELLNIYIYISNPCAILLFPRLLSHSRCIPLSRCPISNS